MLFRPSYCAHCGEKIERAEWHLWTSRRFCELCAMEFRGIDLIPKVAAITGVLGIALAASGYIGRGPTSTSSGAAKQLISAAQRPAVVSANGGSEKPVQLEASPTTKMPLANTAQQPAVTQQIPT